MKFQQFNKSPLETEIDRMVYQLYGLTEEEIGIVEGEVGQGVGGKYVTSIDLENIEALLAGILHSVPFKRMSEKFASYENMCKFDFIPNLNK